MFQTTTLYHALTRGRTTTNQILELGDPFLGLNGALSYITHDLTDGKSIIEFHDFPIYQCQAAGFDDAG